MITAEARQAWSFGALSAAPLAARTSDAPGGISWPLGKGARMPQLYVPRTRAARPLPLVVLLHGAGGGAGDILPVLRDEAEGRGFLVLVPQSAGVTWDLIAARLGPDVAVIDQALLAVFEHYPVDPARIAIAGFSDGASYALTLGLANGQLFRTILAFSPGFVADGLRRGRPEIYMSHGRQDNVLPIDRCSRRIVERLRAAAYEVDYEEFAGGHVVPAERVAAGLELLLR